MAFSLQKAIAGGLAELKNIRFSGRGGTPYTSTGWLSNLGGYFGGDSAWNRGVANAPSPNIWDNSAVAACLSWGMDNFAECPPQVLTKNPEGKYEPLPDHALLDLLDTPNEFYDGEVLFSGTIMSLAIDGNAYWLKDRSQVGIAALYYVPWWQVQPVWPKDGSKFLTGYVYKPDGFAPQELAIADVVHFRRALDPANTRRGWSPLKSAGEEVATDTDATFYTRTILQNGGVSSGLVTPADKDGTFGDQVGAIKTLLQASTNGAERAKFVVVDYPLNVQPLGSTPEQMALDKIRRMPESRICATLRIPAMVVGLAVGENQRTYANMREAREQGAEEFIVPMGRVLASGVRRHLLPEFERNVKGLRIGFDYAQMRILAEDRSKVVDDQVKLYKGGLCTRAEGRAAVGLKTKPEDDVYYLPSPGQTVPEDEAVQHIAEPQLAQLAPGQTDNTSGNGTGGAGTGGSGHMATARNGQGAAPAKSVKFNPNHDPHSGQFTGGGVVSTHTYDPAELIHREDQQEPGRIEDAENLLKKTGDKHPPITTVRTEEGAEIIDGHHRALAAENLGMKINGVEIKEAQYDKLTEKGFDGIEISWGMLTYAGHKPAARMLDKQFVGADVAKQGAQVVKLLKAADAEGKSLFFEDGFFTFYKPMKSLKADGGGHEPSDEEIRAVVRARARLIREREAGQAVAAAGRNGTG